MKFLFSAGVLLAFITTTVKAADNHGPRRTDTIQHSKRIPLHRRSNAPSTSRFKRISSTTTCNQRASNNTLLVNDNPPSSGLINVVSPSCGVSNATPQTTDTSGPNGNIDWLNCGINSASGWNPPDFTISDLIAVDLSDAVNDPNGAFQACSNFIPLFQKYGEQFNIPPIMLASFAMQESSCNATEVGHAGEQGLMQLTPDKCQAAPGGPSNCKNPDYNIMTAASFFADTLKAQNNNVLLSIGTYNGWTPKLTIAQVNSACCACQQNLDYLHQYVNGWLQNYNPYNTNPVLGKYHNLDKCSSASGSTTSGSKPSLFIYERMISLNNLNTLPLEGQTPSKL